MVVGAGPGGLAVAMLLARAGLEVDVVERRASVGGRTSRLEVDGFRFDLGPTFVHYPRALEELFASVGRDLHEEVRLVRLDPSYRLVFGAGGELLATPDRARLDAAVAALSPGDVAGVARFMEDNREKFARLRPVLQRAFGGWRDLLSGPVLRFAPHARPWRSLEGELRTYFRDPRVRLAFSFQSKYLGMSAGRCPSLFSILAFLEHEYGVSHPIGGCSALTEAMARVAGSLGVRVRTGEDALQVLFRGRRAVGVRTARRELMADAVVLNADFAAAARRLIPAALRRRWSDARLEGASYSCSAFMLYLGLEGRLDGLSHHTIYVARDYARNLDEIERRHVLSDDPSFYVQNPAVTDPTLAPEGASTLYVLVPVTHRHPNVDWTRERARFRDLALRQLARVGVEDVARRIRVERVVTPDDWATGHRIHLGATFNLAHGLSQLLHLRPRNRLDDVEGVYLVGGATHPGSGLPVIVEGARITARLVVADLGVTAAAPDGDAREAA